jgi:hypothetical protein
MKRMMLLLLPLVVLSCQNPALQANSAEELIAPTQDSALYYLDLVDKSILAPNEYTLAAGHFISADSLIKTQPEYLMKAGLTCMNQEGAFRLYGVNYLILLTNKFPQHEYAPQALLQLALFFDNVLNDSERASEFLRALVARYPENALVGDAQALLNLISVSETGEIEEVRNWLNKN